MQIFAGLGNPGAKYAANRHNIGFMAVDRIAVEHGFGPWKHRFQGELAEGRLGNARVLLLKPMTFMNLSGQSVGEAMRYFKLAPEYITVFHDELDLAPGKLRVKLGGGHAGHNGLRSVESHIGAGFRRVRLGIGHPGRKELVTSYVLQDFARADQNWLDELLRGIAEGAPDLAAGHPDRFMNAVARRMAPAGTRPGSPVAASRPDGSAKAPTAPEDESPRRDGRSALQKLVDRFR